MLVHPEAVHRDAVDGSLLRVERIRPHQELAPGDPDHARERRRPRRLDLRFRSDCHVGPIVRRPGCRLRLLMSSCTRWVISGSFDGSSRAVTIPDLAGIAPSAEIHPGKAGAERLWPAAPTSAALSANGPRRPARCSLACCHLDRSPLGEGQRGDERRVKPAELLRRRRRDSHHAGQSTMLPEAYKHGGKLTGIIATLGFATALGLHLFSRTVQGKRISAAPSRPRPFSSHKRFHRPGDARRARDAGRAEG